MLEKINKKIITAGIIMTTALCIAGCGKKEEGMAIAASFADVEDESVVSFSEIKEKASHANKEEENAEEAVSEKSEETEKETEEEIKTEEFNGRPAHEERSWHALDYIELPDYNNTVISQIDTNVPDTSDVITEAKAVLGLPRNYIVSEKKAKKGDAVVVNAKGTLNGEEYDSVDYGIVLLGSSSVSDEMNDALIGKYAGNDFSFIYPSNDGEIHYKGNIIAIMTQGALNDDMAVKITGNSSSTAESWISELREALTKLWIARGKTSILTNVLKEIWKDVEVKDIPEDLYLAAYDYEWGTVGAVYREGGILEEDYKKNKDAIDDIMENRINDYAKEELICYAIAEKEGIEDISDEEWNEAAELYRTENRIWSAEEWNKWLEENGGEDIEKLALKLKISDRLADKVIYKGTDEWRQYIRDQLNHASGISD